MNYLLIDLWRYARIVKNYTQKRLDLVTRIEIILFSGFLLFYCFFTWNREFSWTLNVKGQVEVWHKFLMFSQIFILSLLMTGYTLTNKWLRTGKNEILLALPVSRSVFARERLLDLCLPPALFYPVWFMLYFLFARYTEMTSGNFVLLAVACSGWYFFAFFSGFLLYLAITFPHQTAAFFIAIIMAALLILSVIFAGQLQTFHFQWLYAISMPAMTIAAGFTMLRILKILAKKYPERLAPKQAKARFQTGNVLFKVYSFLTPPRLKTLVVKDCTYMFRNYKSFLMIFLVLLIVLVAGIGKSTIAGDGIQWYISIIIAAAWVLANASFRFVEQRSENLSIIRSLPVKAGVYWWSKFWLSFLPILWMVIAGAIVYIIRFGLADPTLYQIMAAALFIAFTLIFVQTNFALFSYPYPRYAVIWYNLYLILAVAFFTVLLSPLITIGFLLFGYAAILLVLKRVNHVEIIND